MIVQWSGDESVLCDIVWHRVVETRAYCVWHRHTVETRAYCVKSSRERIVTRCHTMSHDMSHDITQCCHTMWHNVTQYVSWPCHTIRSPMEWRRERIVWPCVTLCDIVWPCVTPYIPLWGIVECTMHSTMLHSTCVTLCDAIHSTMGWLRLGGSSKL